MMRGTLSFGSSPSFFRMSYTEQLQPLKHVFLFSLIFQTILGHGHLDKCRPSMTSCAGSCESHTTDECNCDVSCVRYRNCCHDYVAVCLGGDTSHIGKLLRTLNVTEVTNATGAIDDTKRNRSFSVLLERNLTKESGDSETSVSNSRNSSHNDTGLADINDDVSIYARQPSCKAIVTQSPKDVEIYMITACPQDKIPTDSSLSQLCQDSMFHLDVMTLASLQNSVPLVYNDVVYNNYYCLQCNQEDINVTQVQLLDLTYSCQNKTIAAQSKATMDAEGHSDALVRFLHENCVPQIDIHAIQSHVPPWLYCDDTAAVPECLEERPDWLPYLLFSCGIYGFNISLEGDDCLRCQGLDWVRVPDRCANPEMLLPGTDPDMRKDGATTSFFVLLKLKADDKKPLVCEADQYLDTDSNICKTMKSQCKHDEILLSGGMCLPASRQIIKPDITLHTTNSYLTFIISVEQSMNFSDIISKLKALIFGNNVVHFTQSIVTSNCTTLLTDLASDEHFCFTSNSSITGDLRAAAIITIETFKADFQILSHLPLIKEIAIEITNFDPGEVRSTLCQTGYLEIQNDLLFQSSKDATNNLTFDNYSLPDHGQPGGIRIIFDTSSFILQQFLLICSSELERCNKASVTYTSIEVTNSTWVIIETNEYGKVNISGGNYRVMSNNSILACLSSLQPFISDETPLSIRVQGIMTLVGCVTSVVCLVITLVTYGLFPQIRTIPGLCIVNLSAALMIAQFLFLVGQILTQFDLLCKASGVLQLTFWLVSFAWMNILAYKVYCTFSKTEIKANKGRIWTYCIIGWLIPCLLTSLAVVISVSSFDFDFEFGGDVCWIVGYDGIITFFAAPVLLSVVINIVFFCGTVFQLRRTQATTEKVNKSGRKTLFLASLRLSTVMGFTWIFGFLANINSLWFCQYLFIVLTTMCGVFICLSFVCNRRVMGMYKTLIVTSSEATSRSSSKTSPDKKTVNKESKIQSTSL